MGAAWGRGVIAGWDRDRDVAATPDRWSCLLPDETANLAGCLEKGPYVNFLEDQASQDLRWNLVICRIRWTREFRERRVGTMKHGLCVRSDVGSVASYGFLILQCWALVESEDDQGDSATLVAHWMSVHSERRHRGDEAEIRTRDVGASAVRGGVMWQVT